MLIKPLSVSIKIIFLFFMAIAVVSCGAGSSGGQQSNTINEQGGNDDNDDVVVISSFKNYEGNAAPDDADTQNFRLYLWSNIASESRCGQCHVVGGDAASLPFARDDNINLAYSAITSDSSFINLGSPSSSRIVTYVAGGHNCWKGTSPADNTSCATDLTNYINSWATASSPSSFLGALSLFRPEVKEINTGKRFDSTAPAGSPGFDSLHTTLQTYCSNCHAPESAIRQQPFFGSADIDVAYQAIQNKVDINEPENSRLYVRLNEESHNCWDDCAANSATMLSNINDLLNAFDESQGLPEGLDEVASGGLELLADGFILSNGSRVENDLLAQWKFTENNGVTATSLVSDGSGNDVQITLNLTGDIEWLGAGGVIINEGKLQAQSTAQSRQVFDALKATGEYSLEAWLTPLNVTQGEDIDVPATIVSYSATTERRNFMLSQQLYNYNFYNRNTLAGQPADQNGEPILGTPNALEVAQASLQHVVVTFNAVDGRKVYVNGELIEAAVDPSEPGNFNEWEDDFTLVVGNEVSGDRQWQGSIRLLAIHRTALAEDEIKTNFDIGVGNTYYLMFPIAEASGLADTYIVFQVEDFDNYSYLFSNPIFYTADETVDISNLKVKGLRVGINTRESESGQAYINIDTEIDSNDLTLFVSEENNGGMQSLSKIGTIIPKEFGPSGTSVDQFFITFDEISNNTYSRPSVNYEAPAFVADNDTEQAEIGLKTFAEINASLSELTGISSANAALIDSEGQPIYEVVRQQMPSSENITGFVSAHQMGIAQLAFKYCDVLVDAGGSDEVDFGSFDLDASRNVAFNTDAQKDLIITPLLANLLADDSASHTDDQPTAGNFGDGGTRDILSNLIDTLVANDSSSTASIVKATCATAYSSALMLIQ